MKSGELWKDRFCRECGMQVEIMIEDVQYSMILHLKTHYNDIKKKKLNRKMKSTLGYISCHECKENVVIIHNDVGFTIDWHTLDKHSLDVQPAEESPATCNNGRKHTNMKNATAESNHPLQTSPLNDVFNLLESQLKPHQEFITVNENGEVICKICSAVTIQPITQTIMNEHLKTTFHENRTIQFVTDMFPKELCHVMEFVSINDSNLCCSLCLFNFDLCPNNPNETILSIMKHNLSKEHIKKSTNKKLSSTSDMDSVIIKSFSELDQVINDNRHYLELKFQPDFICKLCNVVVDSSGNENLLYKSLMAHFMSETHLNSC